MKKSFITSILGVKLLKKLVTPVLQIAFRLDALFLLLVGYGGLEK
jgi:hypothetical protein